LQEAQIWREGHREWKIKFLSCIVIFEWIAHLPDYNICSCFECGISKLCQSPFFFSRSEKCIVGTGLERQVALDSGVPAIAEHEGKIIYMDIDKIILSGNGYTVSIPLVISTFQQKYLYTSKNSGLARKMH
jgi:hypothetical protein